MIMSLYCGLVVLYHFVARKMNFTFIEVLRRDMHTFDLLWAFKIMIKFDTLDGLHANRRYLDPVPGIYKKGELHYNLKWNIF
ncbi:hypothetical protein RCL_jg22569.t1 [Rhizophagus clarus]|uniref:Uncharacterized protein n=1 Tax=Rhizophagus clarus TaxID=94130 RepID=A0A8H3MCU7_9GLOM|nr:hypothetical protein RCL_jg22569.t1 [Rhizophagus clarus]